MEYRKLSIAEKSELKERHRKERDGKIRDRIKAVVLYDEGYSLPEIARILFLSDEGVRKHIKDYNAANKLAPSNGGSSSKLSHEQTAELINHLEANNYVYARDIAGYIKSEYGVSYTIAGVTKLLHKLNFAYKKPKLIPGKLDIEKQEEFKLQYALLKGNLAKNEAIYFIDSVHPQYQTRVRYGWIRKNTVKTLPSFSGWKRRHIIGALSLNGLNLVTLDAPRVNSDYLLEFFNKLEAENANKSKIYLICDNAGYHKSKKVKEYLKNSKIELVFLPPYSPNLNPIERLWRFMHSVVTNNKYYPNFAAFSNALQQFFANISKYKDKLSSLINDNFQSIIPNHFSNSSN